MRNVIRGAVVSSISFLLLIVLSPAEAFDVEQGLWQSYRADIYEFSVALPIVPAMRTQNWWLQDLQRSRQERLIGAYADGIVYTMRILENTHGEKLESFARDARDYRWD